MPITFDEVMEFDDARNREVFKELMGFQKEKSLMPFVGAGISAFLKFPVWKKFFDDEFNIYLGQKDGMPPGMDYFEAASHLLKTQSATYFYGDVRNAFGGKWTSEVWESALQQLDKQAAYWLPKLFKNLVITTNFDHNLEHIYKGVPVSDPYRQEPLNHALHEGSPLIYKIHGDISDVEKIVFTKESYEEHYKEGSPLRQALERVFRDKILLFLGCSLSQDKTVEMWQNIAQAGMRHFVIMPCKPGSQQEKRRELGEKKIKAILYDVNDHDAVRVFLERLYSETCDEKTFHNLPERNPYFTGRVDILKSIHDGFKKGGRINLHQTISGLGGIGKTQCALEYGHRYISDYSYVFWVNAESPQLIYSSLKRIAQELKLMHTDTTPDENELQTLIKLWYEEHKDILVIFDNVDNEDNIKPYMPPTEKAHALITSRKMNIHGTKRVDISVFKDKDAVDFMMNRTQRNDKEGAQKVTERLGYLALALDQAAAYIIKTNKSFEGYTRLLDRHGLAVFGAGMELTSEDYKELVTVTWDISLDKIKSESAQQLLNLCAYMAPNNIPIEIFESQCDVLPEPLKEDIQDELVLDSIFADLQEYRLVELKDDKTLSIHRLVQEVVREKIKGDTSWIECCIYMMQAVMPKDYSDRASRVKSALYVEHALSLAEHALSIGIAVQDEERQLDAAYLFYLSADGFVNFGQYEQSLNIYKKELAIREKVLDKEHPDTAVTYNNVAGAYNRQGEYDKSLEWYEKALAICEKVLGKKHPETATTYNNIAVVYHRKGHYAEALECNKKALEIKEKVLGKEHLDTAATYNNIAGVYDSQGDYSKALEWYQMALDVNEKTLDKDHPDTAFTYNNIALVYDNKGEYKKAMEWNKKALKAREKVLGEEHPDTATTYNNIALVYSHLGNYTEAMEWNKKVLKAREKVLGEMHPDTATTYNNIALVYSHLGNYTEAMEWNKKALEVKEKVLGKDCPNTADSYNNIAGVYDSMGNYTEALKWYKKALDVREKTLGKDHPDTTATYNNTAQVYFNQGNSAKALEWYKKALGVCEKVLGKEHPYTGKTYNNIAGVYFGQGDCVKALEWYKKSLEVSEKVLGKDHPDTAFTYNNIALLYHSVGEYGKALEWRKKAMGQM